MWEDLKNFLSRYRKAGDKSSWAAPIPCGFNIKNFDRVIIDRLCKEYGPYDDKKYMQKLFHPLYELDLADDIWRWTDNVRINESNSKSLDSVRDWLGMSRSGSHDAMNDVIDTVEIMRRFILRYRDFYTKTKFAGALAGWQRPVL